MKFTQKRTITVLGFKVGEVEVSSEFDTGGGSERKRSSGSQFAVNPDFMTPILAEAVSRISGLAPEKFSFETGQELMVDGNIGPYTATQELKIRFGFDGSVMALFGLAALTNAYDKQNQAAGAAFTSRIIDVLKENWESQEGQAK